MATDIILRSVKAAALTHAEMDQNWESLAQTVDAITADYTILFTDQNKIIESSIASGTITLPTVASAAGTDTDSFRVTIKNVNSTSLTVSGNAGETIEGAGSVTLLENEAAVFALESAALEWNIIAFYGPNLVGVTASPSEINTLDGFLGVTADLNIIAGGNAAGVSAAEFQTLNGVTSSIQSQLSSKLVSANNLADLGSSSTARSNLGVDAAGTDNSTPVTVVGNSYLALSGQQITANAVNLVGHVTGQLAYGNMNFSNNIVAGDIAPNAIGSSEIVNGAVNKDKLDAYAPGTWYTISTSGTTSSSSFVKVGEIAMSRSGTVTVRMVLTSNGTTAYGRIYVNGVAVGIQRSTGTSITVDENIAVSSGDILQVYARNDGGNPATASIKPGASAATIAADAITW